jgi:hypothetical protein
MDLLGAELERGAFARFGFVGEDADGAVGLEAVDGPSACGQADAQAFGTDGHVSIGADLAGTMRLRLRPRRDLSSAKAVTRWVLNTEWLKQNGALTPQHSSFDRTTTANASSGPIILLS